MCPAKAADRPLTDAELLLLGLVAEMPRHGYELEREIESRGMREWTQIGFSSVYFVLGKLERAGLVRSKAPPTPKARKTFTVTPAGHRALVTRTIEALSHHRPTYSSLLQGMLHWHFLGRDQALESLAARAAAVASELARLEDIRLEGQPRPDHVEVLFDFGEGQLRAEAEWIERTLDYMRTKPWLEE